MKFRQTFGNSALEARKKPGLTQSQVAEAVSISVRWYQKIESGQRLPTFEVGMSIIIFLGIDPENFRDEVCLNVPVHTL